jgi:homoserine dehydrogenase
LKETRLLFVGFGTVGQGCAKHLVSTKEYLKMKYGFKFRVVGIVDTVKGSILNDNGVDLSRALSVVGKGKKLEGSEFRGKKGLPPIDAIKTSDADTLIEATWTNLKDAEPGTSHIIAALKSRIDVATSNKGPLALNFTKLTRLAKSKKRHLKYESTVMSGTPIFNLKDHCLRGARINKIRGILNGTTNFILTEMVNGKDYHSVLKDAQARGYAEVDPTGDVEARDPAAKITILSNAMLNADISYDEVQKEGITKITLNDIQQAVCESKRIKLLAEAYRNQDGKYSVSVKPTLLPENDLLAHVDGVMNAVQFSMNVQPDVTIVGPGAGGDSAGFGLLSDVLSIHEANRLEKVKSA